jgi:hypothetical protein
LARWELGSRTRRSMSVGGSVRRAEGDRWVIIARARRDADALPVGVTTSERTNEKTERGMYYLERRT